MAASLASDAMGGQNVPVILGFFGASLLLVWAIQKHRGGPKNPPPGPWGLPLVGYLPFLHSHVYPSFCELGKKYGHVFQVFMGTHRAVVINSLEGAKQVLVKQSGDFADRPAFHSYKHFAEGKSFSFNNFDEKGKLRKKIARSALRIFTLSSVNPMEKIIWEEASLLLDDLEKVSKEGTIEIQRHLSLAVSSVVYRMAFGSNSVARQDPMFLSYVKAAEGLHDVQDPQGNPTDLLPWCAAFVRMVAGEARAAATQPIVKFFKSKREQVMAEYSPEATRHIADALLKGADETPAHELEAMGLTREDVMYLLAELVSGGRETVTATTSWAVLYLVVHPQCQARLQAEVDARLGPDELPRPADRKKLPYVEAFLLETWRHACLDAFLLPHAAARDTTLDGYDIPKGTLIYINMYAVNRDPLAWDRPTDFDPTRFLDADGNVDKNKAENVMAFGGGKRRCIGELMGRTESFILLSMLCRKFEFLPVPGQTYDVTAAFGMTLIPHKYQYVVKERRK